MAAAPPISIDPESKRELARLQGAMTMYAVSTNGTAVGVIRKNITKVRIGLGKAYRILSPARNKRSVRRKRVNRIWWEFEKRAISGRGVKVANPSLLSGATVDKHGRKMSDWQRAVRRELNSRVSASGYQAYQFTAAYMRRVPVNDRPYHKLLHGRYERNIAKSFGDETRSVLEARVPGTDKQNRKYRIIPRVLRSVTADIELFLKYRSEANARNAFGPERKAMKKAMLARSAAAKRAHLKALKIAFKRA